MGISRNPYMSGSRKTAADMTWRQLLGQQIFQRIRAKGQSNPSSQFLQSQAIAAFLWPIFQRTADVVRVGFTSRQEKQNAANSWFKYAYQHAFDLTMPGATGFDADLILFGKGTMTAAPSQTVAGTSAAAKTVHITWDATLQDSSQLDSDLIYVALYNRTTKEWAILGGQSPRSTGTVTGTQAPGFLHSGDQLSAYIGFYGDASTATFGTSATSIIQTVTVGA